MFKHEVIDNFMNEYDFNELCSLNLSEVENNKKKVYNNRVFKNGTIESSCIDKNTVKRLHENYHPIAIKLLRKFAPEKEDLYEYSDFHIVVSGKNHSYPIHSDTLNKLLSGVIYLKPDSNHGTVLYNKNKNKSKKIDWKINRGFFFSRSDETLHSYKSDNVSQRVTLIYNLMTTNIKGVCKAEKKYYFYFLIKNFISKLFNKIF
tara:strand:+ start:1028 stop:1639 length:612 start_codon:yes stop_codon:yes gene_type:complete